MSNSLDLSGGDPSAMGGGAPPPAPAPPAPPPAPAAVDDHAEPANDPKWLSKRLERERSTTISKLGFKDEADAKAAAEARRVADESRKTSEQKALEASQRAETEANRANRATAAATEYAARMMVGLTDAQKAVVTKLAGADPVAQVETIMALAPTWAAAGAPPAPVLTPPAAPPVSTAPPANAPAGNTPPPADKRGSYETIRKTNPFEAAAFGNANPEVYVPKAK